MPARTPTRIPGAGASVTSVVLVTCAMTRLTRHALTVGVSMIKKKLHMASLVLWGRRITFFFEVEEGEKPVITSEMIDHYLGGLPRGVTFSVGL